jgi:hypothetical protein
MEDARQTFIFAFVTPVSYVSLNAAGGKLLTNRALFPRR